LEDARNYLRFSPNGVLKTEVLELVQHAQLELATHSAALN